MLRKLSKLLDRDVRRCFFCRAGLHVLQKIYGFDPWHARWPYACAPYQARAVALVAKHAPNVVVDVGCGLGEVLARVPARRRFGFDLSPRIVRAGRLLHGRKVQFMAASLAEPAQIAQAVAAPIDVLIMTNWLHGFEMSEIVGMIGALRSKIPVRLVLMDTIRPGLESYRYRHSIGDLSQVGEVVETVDAGDGLRDLNLVRLAGPIIAEASA